MNDLEFIKEMSKCHKKPYKTEKKAKLHFKKHAKGAGKFGRVPPPTKIYQCQCGYWHITTKL